MPASNVSEGPDNLVILECFLSKCVSLTRTDIFNTLAKNLSIGQKTKQYPNTLKKRSTSYLVVVVEAVVVEAVDVEAVEVDTVEVDAVEVGSVMLNKKVNWFHRIGHPSTVC